MEDFSCARKSTRKVVYYLILNEIFVESKEIFYAIFSAFLVIVVSKNIKLHCNNLLSKFKYYKEMIKYLLTSEFLQITFTEIKILQLKEV